MKRNGTRPRAGAAGGVSDAGYYGEFGGRYIPEPLMEPLLELERAFGEARSDGRFAGELDGLLSEYAGRPTPLYRARNLTRALGGARVYLKREDLCHTGSHKVNNTLGQCLLAKRMGKRRVIAETGAGQHGVACATAAALFGQECVVFMGTVDIERQAPNVSRMELLGAEVRPVATGGRTLKDAVNEAFREWVATVETTHYCIGSVVGPHPFPEIVRTFQSVIGREAAAQHAAVEGRAPDAVIACVGGGSNSIGIFSGFLDAPTRLIGVEAGGGGPSPGRHGATLCLGERGVLHGALSYLLQDADGQVLETHSVSAGLDYPGVGPEHSHLKEIGRAEYTSATDAEALQAARLLSRTEGIIPALESAHAVAAAVLEAPRMSPDESVVVCLSGRGDKDMKTLAGGAP